MSFGLVQVRLRLLFKSSLKFKEREKFQNYQIFQVSRLQRFFKDGERQFYDTRKMNFCSKIDIEDCKHQGNFRKSGDSSGFA